MQPGEGEAKIGVGRHSFKSAGPTKMEHYPKAEMSFAGSRDWKGGKDCLTGPRLLELGHPQRALL
jgi:hypothetical protein